MARLIASCSVFLLLIACSSDPDERVGGDAGGDAAPTEGGPPVVADSGPDAAIVDVAADGPTSAPDASPDAGPLSCEEAPHDPVLGTARLGTAFRVVESAVLPGTSWLPVSLVDEAPTDGGVVTVVYGYAGDGRVHRLGVWPQLAAPAAGNVAFDAVSTPDRSFQVLTTPLLPTTRGHLLAGYRTVRGAAFVGGGVSLFDTAHPEAGTRWLAAPGIESALGLGSYVLVGGDGLGGATSGPGVYAATVDTVTPRPGLLATYPTVPDDKVRPGLMAVSQNGIVVLGHYLDLAARHSLRLPDPGLITAALAGGAPVDLGAAAELTPADDVANVVGFVQGVAVLHTRVVRGVLPALGRLDHYPLSRPAGAAATVVGTPATVLSAPDDGCTVVSQLVPVAGGGSIIVGLWDRNGQRLVRVAPR